MGAGSQAPKSSLELVAQNSVPRAMGGWHSGTKGSGLTPGSSLTPVSKHSIGACVHVTLAQRGQPKPLSWVWWVLAAQWW